MAQIIEAPNCDAIKFASVFLAGGITKCEDWQSEVIKRLEPHGITVFNPRRKRFDISDATEELRQITWEFRKLEEMDIFSMYFCNSESVQPICMYELGRYICRMQERFPNDWKDRIVISVEKGYSRAGDVFVQTNLAGVTNVYANASPGKHADRILQALDKITSGYNVSLMFG